MLILRFTAATTFLRVYIKQSTGLQLRKEFHTFLVLIQIYKQVNGDVQLFLIINVYFTLHSPGLKKYVIESQLERITAGIFTFIHNSGNTAGLT